MYDTKTIFGLFREVDEHPAQLTEQERETYERLRAVFDDSRSLDADSLVTLYGIIDNLDARMGGQSDDDGLDEWS